MILLIICISCGTRNKPVSDAQKEKIKGEVKEVVNSIFKNSEEANFNNIIESYFDSTDYVCTYNGNSFGYKQAMAVNKSYFNSLINQKCTILEEKYAILDNSTVVYTANTKWLTNFKDGHSVLQDPRAIQYIFKKTDDEWRIINVVLSGPEKIVKYKEQSKDLNQVDLWKKFSGTWKGEIARDTFIVYEEKPYGTGMENKIKIITKDKILQEGIGLFGYDIESDKIIEATLLNGSDIICNAFWFTSENTCEGIPFKDIPNPETADLKWKIEFKSPDMWVVETIKDNKTIEVDTLYRVKK
jgi:hypothetical protein